MSEKNAIFSGKKIQIEFEKRFFQKRMSENPYSRQIDDASVKREYQFHKKQVLN